jgi:pentatricopeptide repeat protein
MVRVADRICHTKNVNDAGLHETRLAFQYFSGTRSRPFTTDTDYAGQLWRVIVEHGTDHSIQHILATDDSPSGGLLNLLEQYFSPFRGTSSSTKITTLRRGLRDNEPVLCLALKRASVVEADMRLLRQRGLLTLDSYTCNLSLALWSHRCLFLSEFGSTNLDRHTAEEALGGKRTVEECLHAMQGDIDDFLQASRTLDACSMYNILIGAWTNSGLKHSVEKVQERLEKMEADPSMEANIVTYNSILHAYSQWIDTDSQLMDRASQLFARMKEHGKVDVVSYATLILTYARGGQYQKGEELLEHMEISGKTTGIYPNDICYNTILDAYSQAASVEAAQRAEALVEKMTQLSKSGENKLAAPDRVSYTSVIKAWRNSGSRSAAERAEALLYRCQELSDGNSAMKPDLVMFNMVLSVWSRVSEIYRGSDVGAQGAANLLSRMKGDDQTLPDTISYNTVMQAWSKSECPNSVPQVLNLLEEMKSSDARRCKPDHRTYNAVLNALAKSRTGNATRLVEDFLTEIRSSGIPPTVIQYNILMDTIVSFDAKNAAKRTEAILRMMEDEARNGNSDLRPNMHSYNTVMNAYSKSGDPNTSQKIEALLNRIPIHERSSSVSLTTLLDAHARAGRADAAEALLRDMLNNPETKVTTISFNTVINAYSKSDEPDAPLRAEALLAKMYDSFAAGNHGVKPNAITFSSVINCWANSKRSGAAERAESILYRMEELADKGHDELEPTAIAYSTTISAWARSGLDEAPYRAKALLNRMEEAHKASKRKAKPSHYCYNAVLNAIAKGNSESKAHDAESMLERMKQALKAGNEAARPTNTTYSTVLNACAFSKGTPEHKVESFQVARRVFRELLQTDGCEPNAISYVNFLSCCGILLPQGEYRTNFACSVFRQCYQQGLMQDKVVVGFRRAVDPVTYYREMEDMDRFFRGADHSSARSQNNSGR